MQHLLLHLLFQCCSFSSVFLLQTNPHCRIIPSCSLPLLLLLCSLLLPSLSLFFLFLLLSLQSHCFSVDGMFDDLCSCPVLFSLPSCLSILRISFSTFSFALHTTICSSMSQRATSFAACETSSARDQRSSPPPPRPACRFSSCGTPAGDARRDLWPPARAGAPVQVPTSDRHRKEVLK